MAKPALARRPAQSARGFVYQRRDPGVLKQRAEQTGGRFDSPFKKEYDTFRPKVGDNLIRILPPTWPNSEHYALDLYMHRFIGQDTSNYLCLYKMLGKPCPICAASKEAKDAGELDESKALGYAKMACAWMLDRDDEQKEHPMLFAMGWAMDRDIAALCWNKRTGKALTIDHPTEGYDVTIKRTGQMLMTRYLPQIDREPSNIDDDEAVQDRILDYITEHPIPETLQYYDNAYLTKVMSGTAVEKDKDLDEEVVEEGEEEVAPPRRRAAAEEPARRSTRRPAADEGDEEEDAAPPPRRRAAPVEEEDEAPPPRRRPVAEEADEEEVAPPRRRAAPPPEEEEDEDPAPTRRSTTNTPPPRRAARPVEEEEEEEAPPPRRPVRRPAAEDEGEAPAARRGPPRRAAPAEEEEEIIEEEDEAPPPRRPAARR